MKVGFTCGTFDLFHAGHVAMLKEARENCDILVVGLQNDPSIDRKEKNVPVQSIIERQIQLVGCKYVDEVWVYNTEADLEQMLWILNIQVRFLGAEYVDKEFTGKSICIARGIDIHFNQRNHTFSSTELRQRVSQSTTTKEANVHS